MVSGGGVSEFDKYGLLVLMHKPHIFSFSFESASKFSSNAFLWETTFFANFGGKSSQKVPFELLHQQFRKRPMLLLLRDREKKPPY